MTAFGEWVKEEREAQGLSRNWLAAEMAAEISPQYIEDLENGTTRVVNIALIGKFIKVLGVDEATADAAYYAAGRVPQDIQERLLAGGPQLWWQLRREFFGDTPR